MDTKYKVRYCSNPKCCCNTGGSQGLYTHNNGVRPIRINKLVLVLALILVLAIALKVSNTLKTKDMKNRTLQVEMEQLQSRKDSQIKQIETDKAIESKAKDDQINSLKTQYDAQIQDLNKRLQSHVAAKAVLASAKTIPTLPAGNCEAYRPLIAQYNWNQTIAMAVMQAESGCSPIANNATDGHRICLGSKGLFQIGCDSTKNYAAMTDPVANIAQAYAIYAARGWNPWGAYTSGSYLKYI